MNYIQHLRKKAAAERHTCVFESKVCVLFWPGQCGSLEHHRVSKRLRLRSPVLVLILVQGGNPSVFLSRIVSLSPPLSRKAMKKECPRVRVENKIKCMSCRSI